jgi:hypothetical protein
VGAYNPRYPLIIDPGLDYSTFLGGGAFDEGSDIAVRDGRAYVTGETSSTDFRTTQGAFDRTPNGFSDAFVTKFNASGSGLEYSTYLGGTNSDEGGGDIAVLDGRAYVTGTTSSIDYPTTQGAFDTTLGGFQDAFVTKFNASGSALVYSTYLGGTSGERGEGIAVDGSGRVYVTGSTFSDDYPTTTGAFDTSFNGGVDRNDAFVTKFNAAGSALDYSTFLGGMDGDTGFGIAVGGSGRAYVTGRTESSDFPTTTGAFDTTFGPSSDTFSSDAFVTKLPTA